MMEQFNEPTIEMIAFGNEDIITQSSCGTSYAGGYDGCTSGNAPDAVQ